MNIKYFIKLFFIVLFFLLSYYFTEYIRFNTNVRYKSYEVRIGELIDSKKYNGMILRDETVFKNDKEGYIYYYNSNLTRVRKNELIYSIKDNEFIYEDRLLTKEDLKSIEDNIDYLNNSITDDSFLNLYAVKSNIEAINREMSFDYEKRVKLDDCLENGYAEYSGVISYNIDGYESINLDNYSVNIKKNKIDDITMSQNHYVKDNTSVYKVVKSPEYNIVFESDDELVKDNEEKKILVYVINKNIETTGVLKKNINEQGNVYYSITINKFLEEMLDERFVDFIINNKKSIGLKLPISAVKTIECFKVNKQMLSKNPKIKTNIVTIMENNKSKNKVIDVLKEDDNYFYISKENNNLKYGDILINKDNEKFVLSDIEKLYGVYSIESGYLFFKVIDIIDSSSDYCIANMNVRNSLKPYETIVLNAALIK